MLATCDHCGGEDILLATVFRRAGGVTNWWECNECGELTIEERDHEKSEAYKGSPKAT